MGSFRKNHKAYNDIHLKGPTMNIKKNIKTIADNATGLAISVGFLAYVAVASVPVVISNANQAVTNKIFS